MLIKFNDKNKTFRIENCSFTYLIKINEFNILEKLYFGKKLNESDNNLSDFASKVYGDNYSFYDLNSKKEVSGKESYFGQGSLVEAPSFMSYDKGEPLIAITHDDNSSVTDFRYVSHKIYDGKPIFDDMPYIKCEKQLCKTLEIKLKDIKSDIFLILYYSLIENKSVIIRHNEIISYSKSEVKINKAYSMCLDLPDMNYKVLSVYGKYASDRLLEEQEIKHNQIIIGDNAGGKGFYHNPMMMLKSIDSNDATGEAIGFGLVYSGNFKFLIQGLQLDETRVLLGLNDENLEISLEQNQKFKTPEAVMVYSCDGSDFVTNTFHDLIRENLLRRSPFEKENIIVLNSWEATYFDFNTEKILSFIDSAKKLNINMVVLDDGWFGKRNNDFSSLGDWEVNFNKINLHKVIDYAHSLDIKFGLWVEPEMISYDSGLFKNNPSFALFDKTTKPTVLRHQFVLDLTSKIVRDNIFNQLTKVFDEYKVDYVKRDFNRLLTEAYSQTLDSKHQKEIFHLFTLGTYDLLNRFVNRYPNILLETCAGGGGRFDMGMLFYSSQIWGSDETDAIQRTKIQYATNIFYPLKVIGSHVSSRKFLSIKEKAAVAMFGTFGYELDPLKLNKSDIKEVDSSNRLYCEFSDLIKNGNYYSLINPFVNSNFVSWMVIDKNKDVSVVFFMNYLHSNRSSRHLKLKGLDPSKKYLNSLTNEVYYGDYYLNIGLNLSMGMVSFTPQIIKLWKI